MRSMAIIGAQWGDEGKGKITDYFSQNSDYVVRFQGGNNAGHTIVVGDKTTILHVIPSGVLSSNTISIIGHGVVLDPETFRTEVQSLLNAGVSVSAKNLKISQNCSIITIYNKLLDAHRESDGQTKIGTTGKGIGPTYEDKCSRRGIKARDLLDKELLIAKLSENFREKEILFKHLYKIEAPTIEQEADRLFELGKFLAPFIEDTFSLLDKACHENKTILFEGAQGILLDVDYGTYPYVTSSNTSFGGIYTGAGMTGRQIDEVIGIFKAYTTRVGEGPFPTEIFDPIGDKIQTIGNEFGATTGRKRRCGWLDLPLLKYACKVSQLTSIALTKVDVLTEVEELKICYAYEIDGKTIDCAYPGIDLYRVKPLYKEVLPIKEIFSSPEVLSQELKDYVELIQENLGIPVNLIAYGPERNQLWMRKPYFH